MTESLRAMVNTTEHISSANTERRQHHALREIFPEACRFITPLIESADKVLGVSGFSLTHSLKERYPELSATEVQVLVVTIQRLHREGRLHDVQ